MSALTTVEKALLLELTEAICGIKAREAMKIIILKGEATDEEIAKEVGLQVNEVRTLLHKLFDARLLKYRRVRDEKIGWYTYYWRVTDESIEDVLRERKERVISRLKARLEYEKSNTFYICINRDIPRLTFDEAFNNMFRCPVCGSILEPYDNKEIIALLEELIHKLEKL
ncbi:MAG: transcription factor E [Thermofilum sp. ex4484_15]|nr:MAG: transcription factor E [Thermofilum sp. ex4484_15]